MPPHELVTDDQNPEDLYIEHTSILLGIPNFDDNDSDPMDSSRHHSRVAFTALLAAGLLVLLLSPLAHLASAVTATFTASATVGNSNPLVYYVDPSQSLTGAATTTATVYVFFNASDSNGYGDINVSSAIARIRNGSEERNSSTCTLNQSSAQTTRIRCVITLYYFDSPGTWTINASVKDNASVYAENTSQTLTVSNIDSITLVDASIAFSGSPGASNVAATQNPQTVNNTGNLDYTSLNLTAYSFTSGALTIEVGNVTVNTSDSGGLGHVLINNTEVIMDTSSIANGVVATRDLYFWLDVPGGQPAGSYSSPSNWIVEAIQ